jgi:hypothetical protein
MISVGAEPVIWTLAAVATVLLLVWTFWPASTQRQVPDFVVEESDQLPR